MCIRDSLIHRTKGNGVSRRMDSEAKPTIGIFEKDNLNNTIQFDASGSYENTVTEEICDTTGAGCETSEEGHRWLVVSRAATAETPMGEQTGFSLQYDAHGLTRRFTLVPDFGFTNLTDELGVSYQVCAARVCDAAGTCTGASACDRATLAAACEAGQ